MMTRSFQKRFEDIHKNHAKAMYGRLRKRITNFLKNTKFRAKKTGTYFDIKAGDVQVLLNETYGLPCYWCQTRIIKLQTLQFDHKVSVAADGKSVPENMRVICKICNKMKGTLTEEEFANLLALIKTFTPKGAEYVTRKLQKGDKLG